jgi:hypothetical protein
VGEDEPRLRLKYEINRVIEAGIWHVRPDDVVFLSEVCGAQGPDLALVRKCLVRHLTKLDHDKHISDARSLELSALNRRTCFNLILFRYPREFAPLQLTGPGQTYEQAGQYWGGRGVGGARVRQGGGPKEQVVEELIADLLAEWRVAEEAPIAATRTLDDIRDHFRMAASHELGVGFWWRSSTQRTLDVICREISSGPVTIYAGGDGHSDVGLPLHDLLVAEALTRWLPDDPLFRSVSPMRRHETADEVVNWITQYCGPRFTGSVLSELVRALPIDNRAVRPGDSDLRLRAPMLISVDQERPTSGLVARSVRRLAEAIKSAGNGDVQILSSFVDADLEAEVQPAPYRYAVRDQLDSVPLDDDVIPITYMAGQIDRGKPAGELVLGEADYIAAEPSRIDSRGLQWSARMAILEKALVETVVLFVGTDLTDPGVLAALAATKHFKVPRYAIVMAPNGPELAEHEHRALISPLLAQRYLHLGVVPVMVDFPAQAVQVLRELASGLEPSHVRYEQRLERWWQVVGPALGRVAPDDGDATVDTAGYSAALDGVLMGFKESLERLLQELTPGSGGDDVLDVTLWIRDADQRMTTLFPASSTGSGHMPAELQLTACADVGRNASRDDLLPAYAFREGSTVRTYSYDATTMTVAVPLILEGAWKHLPVGVVTIESSEPRGRLSQIAQDAVGLESLADATRQLSSALGQPATFGS